jgi:hypothetical protein
MVDQNTEEKPRDPNRGSLRQKPKPGDKFPQVTDDDNEGVRPNQRPGLSGGKGVD